MTVRLAGLLVVAAGVVVAADRLCRLGTLGTVDDDPVIDSVLLAVVVDSVVLMVVEYSGAVSVVVRGDSVVVDSVVASGESVVSSDGSTGSTGSKGCNVGVS